MIFRRRTQPNRSNGRPNQRADRRWEGTTDSGFREEGARGGTAVFPCCDCRERNGVSCSSASFRGAAANRGTEAAADTAGIQAAADSHFYRCGRYVASRAGGALQALRHPVRPIQVHKASEFATLQVGGR